MRKVEIFYHFGKLLNMTKVGEKLCVSQSAISQSLKELETEYNVKLFNKIGKQNYLTSEGEILHEYFRKIYFLYQESKATLETTRKIKIGASTTIGIYVLPNLIKEFLEKNNSEIDISISIENTDKIINSLLNNEIDFAFIEGFSNHKDIVEQDIWKDELIFINKYMENNKIIKTSDLYSEKLIAREKGSGTRDTFESYLNSRNISFNISFELGNTEAIKKAVEAGMGISCLSKLAVAEELNNKKLSQIFIDDINITRFFKLVYYKEKYFNKNMKNFINFLNINL